MDLRFTPEQLAFRDEVRDFFRTSLPAEIKRNQMKGHRMSKEDIVTDLATVPYGVLEPHVVQFDAEGDLKATLRSIMTSKDFVSF